MNGEWEESFFGSCGIDAEGDEEEDGEAPEGGTAVAEEW